MVVVDDEADEIDYNNDRNELVQTLNIKIKKYLYLNREAVSAIPVGLKCETRNNLCY
jgi:hypothetical protein